MLAAVFFFCAGWKCRHLLLSIFLYRIFLVFRRICKHDFNLNTSITWYSLLLISSYWRQFDIWYSPETIVFWLVFILQKNLYYSHSFFNTDWVPSDTYHHVWIPVYRSHNPASPLVNFKAELRDSQSDTLVYYVDLRKQYYNSSYQIPKSICDAIRL